MSGPVPPVRDRYHELTVKRLVAETPDSISVVFQVPGSLGDAYAYESGQFVTLRIDICGDTLFRSYSMSSAPCVDDGLQVTVKRVPDGVVSNWINDSLAVGDIVEVSLPTGNFVLTDSDDDLVAFAGGSGITPVFSLVKTALLTTDRKVRLLFANRDRRSAIFGDALDELADRFADRLSVQHLQDVQDGPLTPSKAQIFAAGPTADVYICGPSGFMDAVGEGLEAASIDPARIHLERFTPPPTADATEHGDHKTSIGDTSVTITLGGRTETVEQRGTTTILQSARWAGLQAPSTCEAGHCATCMAQLVEGEVDMMVNDALTPEEVAEGLVLTCQSVPRSDVRVVYDL